MGEISFMDLLYSRYSNPMELVRSYIRRGRFGEFVTGILQAENDRRRAEARKDADLKEWIAYVHSDTEKSFNDWKTELIQKAEAKTRNKTGNKAGSDHDLDDKGIQAIMDKVFKNG